MVWAVPRAPGQIPFSLNCCSSVSLCVLGSSTYFQVYKHVAGCYVLTLKGLYCVKDCMSKEKAQVAMLNGAWELLKCYLMKMVSSQREKLD